MGSSSCSSAVSGGGCIVESGRMPGSDIISSSCASAVFGGDCITKAGGVAWSPTTLNQSCEGTHRNFIPCIKLWRMFELERRRSSSLSMRFSSTRRPLNMTCVCRPRSSLSCTRGKIAFHSSSVIFLRMPQEASLLSYCDFLRKHKLDSI
jgi:hypothetical protein